MWTNTSNPMLIKLTYKQLGTSATREEFDLPTAKKALC